MCVENTGVSGDAVYFYFFFQIWEKHLRYIILNFDLWFRWCLKKSILVLVAILSDGAKLFVQYAKLL